ncbi:MAG: tetratricopeptide repeat protein, partial [Bryobacteraceae bacterium]
DAAVGRYRFHVLVRLFARERLEEEEAEKERLACRLRAARWLNQRAGEWAALLRPGDRRRAAAQEEAQATGRSVEEVEREWEQEALAGFERERENLVAAVEWADEAGDEPLTVALALNLVGFFDLRAHWPEWEKTHERALAAARRAGDRHGEAQTLGNLGIVYRLQGRWEEAIACYEKALPIFRALG